jgi:HAD superfamily hydrolase (TIGR01490 family)
MRLALFDFDGTLTRRDTLLPFLRLAAGTTVWLVNLVRLSPLLAAYASGMLTNDLTKEAVLRRFLRGRPKAELDELGAHYARSRLDRMIRRPLFERYLFHRRRGDVCVIVSASLDVYLEPWARRHGFDAVLCSRLEYQSGLATGRLAGANCYGPEKVRRIEQWLAGRVPETVIAYGDSRGDREMLAIADVSYRVSRG